MTTFFRHAFLPGSDLRAGTCRNHAARWTRCAVVVASLLGVAGCVLPVAESPAPPPPAVTPNADVGAYLDLMQRLGSSDPTLQSDLFHEAERAYVSAPTTANSLRYALALVIPGHPGTNAAEGKKVLETLLASPEKLLPNERLLASVFLQETAARLKLQADASRLLATVDERTRAQANSDRRMQVQLEENAKLRKALEEAQAKLDAIRDIERTIIERNPSPPGAPGSRSEPPVEAQSPPAGR